MNPQTRRIAAEMAIALAACVLAHEFLVAPAERRVELAQGKLAQAQAASLAARPSLAESAESTADVERAIASLAAFQERSTLARDEATLFGHLIGLSTRFNVRLDQMQATSHNSGKPATPEQDPQGAQLFALIDATYTLDCWGSYDDLARFVRAIEEDVAFTCVRSLRLNPRREDDQAGIHAILTIAVHGVDVQNLAIAQDAEPAREEQSR
ncbi:MAG: hypothetical protein SFZ23_06350 [Planctomycetota bacterium]|nr:hypothetical protein [Planctomycetota bacterium]